FARRAVGALRGRRHALLAQELDRLVEVAGGLLKGALALHHPRARRVAELLDHCCGDVGHALSPSSVAFSPGSTTSFSGASATSAAAGAAGAAGAGASSAAAVSPRFWRISPGVTRCLPASMPSAIAFTISPHERMASSLPGIT